MTFHEHRANLARASADWCLAKGETRNFQWWLKVAKWHEAKNLGSSQSLQELNRTLS